MPMTVALPANGPHGQPRMLSVTVAPRTIVWRKGGLPRMWLSYVLSRAATLNVTLNARVDGTWQQVAVFTRHSEAGAARVQLVGRWKGLLFPARKVQLQVSATAAGMPSGTRRRSPSPSSTASLARLPVVRPQAGGRSRGEIAAPRVYDPGQGSLAARTLQVNVMFDPGAANAVEGARSSLHCSGAPGPPADAASLASGESYLSAAPVLPREGIR